MPSFPHLSALALTVAAAIGAHAAIPGARAADLPSRRPPPAPVFTEEPDDRYIWGAIAFSPATGRHGFFWGGATRAEATGLAQTHCLHAGGTNCGVVSEFRSYRSRWDAHPLGPAPICGALSVPAGAPQPARNWGAASAPTLVDAEREALGRCGGPQLCIIREWVCT